MKSDAKQIQILTENAAVEKSGKFKTKKFRRKISNYSLTQPSLTFWREIQTFTGSTAVESAVDSAVAGVLPVHSRTTFLPSLPLSPGKWTLPPLLLTKSEQMVREKKEGKINTENTSPQVYYFSDVYVTALGEEGKNRSVTLNGCQKRAETSRASQSGGRAEYIHS